MLPDLLGLLTAAAVLAVPFVTRRLRAARTQAAGVSAAPPAVPGRAGAAAARPVTVHPRATEPFASDGIVTVGEES